MAKKKKTARKPKVASELEYLKWFRVNADFGPADGDIQTMMNEQFERLTGKRLPPGWDCCDDCGESKYHETCPEE